MFIKKIVKILLMQLLFKKEFIVTRSLPLPKGLSEKEAFDFIMGICVEGAPLEEIRNYASQDFKRFLFTVDLTKNLSGRLLELGANPYFTTMLLYKFFPFQLELANYFGKNQQKRESQNVDFLNLNGEKDRIQFEYEHFNIEESIFPYEDASFDVVIFAEILEHLLNDPVKVLREIKRVLKPNAHLILTTPNASRLENIANLIDGNNIYDQYSGYGPYGRHNREYTISELEILLNHVGFEVLEIFSEDVHSNFPSRIYGSIYFRFLLKKGKKI